MGLVAPVVSAAVAVPVVAGLAAGDRPGDLAALGLFAVVLGLALARAPAARRKGNPEHQHLGAALMVAPGRPPTAALAAGAALGFGLVYVLLAHAAAGSAYMAVLTFRCTSLTMLGLWFVMHRETTRPTRREVLTLGLIGTADIAAGTAYTAAAAASGALLTIDALLYNTYPIGHAGARQSPSQGAPESPTASSRWPHAPWRPSHRYVADPKVGLPTGISHDAETACGRLLQARSRGADDPEEAALSHP